MLWIAPIFSTACGEIQGSINKESKDPGIQDLNGQLLREEAGHRTEEGERVVNEERVELDLADAEAEVGRLVLSAVIGYNPLYDV